MKIYNINLNSNINIKEPLNLAIGNFDGVHLGHQQLLINTKEEGIKRAVMTFNPHPYQVLKNIKPYLQLTNLEEKINLIAKFDIDYLFIVEFDKYLASLKKDEFINFLNRFNINKIICGYDFSFGIKGEGNISDLKNHFNTIIIDKFMIDNVRVSSTYIKELLNIADLSSVKRLLGRSYSIKGKVFQGKKLGRTINYPTANIDYENLYLPKRGVYASRILINDKYYYGMTNIGYNPTVDYKDNIKVEVNIFDFNKDIYDITIEIFLDKLIRNEHKFKDILELKEQLKKDSIEIKSYYNLGE